MYFHKQSPLDKISLHSRGEGVYRKKKKEKLDVVSLVVYISWEWKYISTLLAGIFQPMEQNACVQIGFTIFLNHFGR
jgi:hypothetical protein